MTPKAAAENMTEAVSYLIAIARTHKMEMIADQLTQVRAKLVMQSHAFPCEPRTIKEKLQQRRLSKNECD